MKKRIISLLMVALMLVSLVPMSVMAESDWGGIIGGGQGYDHVYRAAGRCYRRCWRDCNIYGKCGSKLCTYKGDKIYLG